MPDEKVNYRAVGLRLRLPKGRAVAFPVQTSPGHYLAELYDVESGEPLCSKYDNIVVNFSPDGAVTVTVKLFPQEITAFLDYNFVPREITVEDDLNA